jgi:DnaJ-like protein
MTRAEALRIFELDDHGTQEQVRAAYRELVKVWHPDRFVHDAGLRAKADRRLREINVAYAVLLDRAEPVETPQEATYCSQVSTPRSEPELERTLRSRAWIVAVGILTVATLIAITTILVRSHPTAKPSERTGDVTLESPNDGATPRDPAAFRPISGTDLVAVPVARGGSLIVTNTDRRDAVLVFVEAGVQRRALYIRAGERLQMLDVARGTYHIWVAGGQTWSHDHFASDQMFQELDAPLTFAKDDTAPQTIVIAPPGAGSASLLRVRSAFTLDLRH